MIDKLDKEMTDSGPVSRLGDILESCIHSEFTDEADNLLRSGFINREERIALSNAISKGLDAFHAAMPRDLANRDMTPKPMDMPDMPASPSMMGMMSQKVKDAVNTVMEWMNGTVDDKAYDTSAWNGSAGQWDTADAYCSDCLIDANPAGAEKTKDKCHLPYRKPGSSQINKNALRAIGAGARSLSTVKGVSPEQKAKAAKWVVSHWKSAFGTPAPDAMYRMAGMKMPSSMEKSATYLYKNSKGEWRVILVYSNKYEDREQDIISAKAHEQYANWVKEVGYRPQITLFHQPRMPDTFWLKVIHAYKNDGAKLTEIARRVFKGYAIAEADRVIYMNGFTMMVGAVYPDMYPVAERLSKKKDLGSSHGFLTTDFSERDSGGMIMNNYYTFEGTILPRDRAANPLTMLALGDKAMAKEKVEQKLNESDQKWLEEVLGPAVTKELETQTKELESTLDAVLTFKDAAEDEAPVEEAPAETPAEVPAEESPAVVEEEAPAEEDTKELVAEVMKALNVEELKQVLVELSNTQKTLTDQLAEQAKMIADLSGTVTATKKSQDEAIAEKMTPSAFSWMPGFKPSAAEETKAEDQAATEKQVKENAPKAPDAAPKSDNPLQQGFWNLLSAPGGVAKQ